MNLFATPDKILISNHPQDMRAGIQRLISIVAMNTASALMQCSIRD